MKIPLIFLCLITFSLSSFSQNVEGEWKGTFETFYPANIPLCPIFIKFHLKKNGKHVVRSYTTEQNAKGKETVIVCNVKYKRIRKDSIILRETAVLNPNGIKNCLQQMYLRLFKHDGITELYGVWKNYYGPCNSKGRINLVKKEN